MFLERDEMKFAVLYTLERYVEPANMQELTEILTFDKQVMGYFELAIILNELIEDGYVDSAFYRGERAFSLSEKGRDTNGYFFERVPKSIRNRIAKAVGERKFGDQLDPNAIQTEILPVALHQYMASLQMLDAGSPLLELKIYAGSRAEADRAAKELHKQAGSIYRDLVKRIGGVVEESNIVEESEK